MVLKKPQQSVVQIGSVQEIKLATPGLTTIANAGPSGNGNGHGTVKHEEEVAAPAGD